MTEPTIRDEWVGKAARAARESIRGREDQIASEDDWLAYIVPAALAAVVDDIRADALQAAATAYQMGGWAKLPQAAGSLATKRQQAEHAIRQMRDRADRIGGRHD